MDRVDLGSIGLDPNHPGYDVHDYLRTVEQPFPRFLVGDSALGNGWRHNRLDSLCTSFIAL